MISKRGPLVPKQSKRIRKRLLGDKQLCSLKRFSWIVLVSVLAGTTWGNGAEPIPEPSYAFLETYCLDCHDDFERKGEISLEAPDIDWDSHEALELWERVINALNTGEMPPQEKRQPSSSERAAMFDWLDERLLEHSPIGGTALRRLNKREYRNSLNALFGIDYNLPDSFPEDNQAHGFDNQGAALTLSGPLLDSYTRVATDLAEKLFPPERKEIEATSFSVPGDDFTYSYSSGSVVDGVMRSVSSSDAISMSATWPSRHEAPVTGRYRIALELSAFSPPEGESVLCRVYAVDSVEAPSQNSTELRQIGEIAIDRESPIAYEFEAILEKGETLALRYANASLKEDRKQLSDHLRKLLSEDPKLAAAFKAADGKVERGRLGWDRLKALMESDMLPDPPVGETLDQLISVIVKNLRSTTETLEYKHYEEGPALQTHGARIYGPIELTDSAEDRYWRTRSEKLIGSRAGRSDQAIVAAFVDELLPRAFRRSVPKSVRSEYQQLARAEIDREGRLNDGLHLALRTALTSPYFLYRGFRDGDLDGYDLAARLSYFLSNRPPDERLVRAARDGSLLNSTILRVQSNRLIDSRQSKDFISSFLDQWLDLAALEDLVPDKTLFENPRRFNYRDDEKAAYIEEPKRFFEEILDTNRPLEDFIDPDFTYTIDSVAQYVYELPIEEGGKKGALRRLDFERGRRFGGLLGMAGVMTATANGVDTQPVVRGVWALENILGSPPPEPPDALPALTPDTSKAETPREMLAAHMAEESCAACHKKIDPVGFVLESFDPVGRWRETYPLPRAKGANGKGNALPVETDGVLPDGTELRDIRDLKAYLVADIRPFAECLSEKLLTYATGRAMGYSDRMLIATIVEENEAKDGGFRDLLLALIDSESFRTK